MGDPDFVPIMGLVVYWYDFVCFAIVGAAVFGSLYILWKREGSGMAGEKSAYESLLVATPGDETFAEAMPRGHVGSHQLWTSCWKGLHPGWLLGIRVISFCVLAGFLSCDVKEWGPTIFVYYTEWTFSLVMLYFAIGSIASARGCYLYYINKPNVEDTERAQVSRNYTVSLNTGVVKLQSRYYQEQTLQRAGFWGYLMQTAFQTCGGAVILTDIVFWCIIVPFLSNAHLKLNLLMGCMHTLNLVFLLLDTSINNISFPWFRLAYFVLWSSAYIIFQWVIHACGFPWWPYPFLEVNTPSAPLWYLVLALAHLPCYGLYAMIVKAKNTLFSKWFPHSYVRTN